MNLTTYKKYFDLKSIIRDIKSYLPNLDEKKFVKAFEFAEKAHKGQFRKDNVTPYITHPAQVVKILISIHADEDTLISAILHDVPEDTSHELSEIKELFGEKIAFLVDGITKLSKVHYRDDMPQRQIESLRKLFLHSGQDLRVILIKLADRLHNMQTLENIKDFKKRVRIAGETLEIYVPVANLLGLQEIKSSMEELCFKNLFPVEYHKLYQKRKDREEYRLKIANEFMGLIKMLCEGQKVEVKMNKRKKCLYSIYKKIHSLGKSVEQIDDRIAIKIVVKNIADCYKVLGIIHGKFVPINDRFRDYIANPKMNGYQSLHTTVFGVDGVLTDIQIRTEKMNFEAEYGIASNFFNDQEISTDKKHSKWVSKILEIEKNQQESHGFMENLKLDIFQNRIFVFTPKGTPIDLPQGATALDFAYAIHSDIGNHASKCEINGLTHSISHILKNGDVVRITVSRKISPELAWISLVKTNLAKSKILEYFRKGGKDKKITEGHKMLQKDLDIAGLGLIEHINFKKLCQKILHILGKQYNSNEELYSAIAEAELRSTDIVKIIKGEDCGKFANINSGEGIKVSLKIMAKNRFGLLRDIADVLYKNVLDMNSLKGWASRMEENAYFTTDIFVTDLETVSRIFDELEQVEGVISVYRISFRGLVMFYLGTLLTAAIWIFHGFILAWISESKFQEEHPFIANFTVYFGLLCLIVTVLYLTSIVKKYFPIVRQKKLLWITSFSLPVLATAVLFVELFFFKIKLSVVVILIEILFIYGYLLISFFNYRKITRQI